MWWKHEPKVEPDPKATEARIRAQRQLEERRVETPRVRAMVSEWRRIRERNHFADAIAHSFRGGKA